MESDNSSGKRICQHCGKPFVPRTRAQYFCSPSCSSLAQDKSERDRIKVGRAIEAQKQDQARLSDKQRLSISDAALLLNVSRPTIYRLIEEGAYDVRFLPDNEDLYCTELVQKSYLDAEGRPVFKSEPMNFRAADGTMPPYWEWLFGKLDMEVPQGMPGTNPQKMSAAACLVNLSVRID